MSFDQATHEMHPLHRGVSIMEDEGHVSDHFSGISAVDGTWHHVAVTWQSSNGSTTLYDNGRKVRAHLLRSIFAALKPCRAQIGRLREQDMHMCVAALAVGSRC